jgi:hypothetical protein
MATLVTTPIKTFVSGETVTPTKLNELSQSTVALTAGTVVAADIASDAVTTAKILDANVTTAKLADSAVTTAKVNDSAVTTAKINNAAVTAAKLDGAQTGSAPIYGCRAWVNFDGTAVTNVGGEDRCTIRANGNVSKVVRGSAGAYTVHFTTAMPDANFATTAFAGNSAGNASLTQIVTTATAASVIVSVVDSTFTGANRDVSVAIFR